MEKPAEPRLTSAGFSMTISNTPIASTDFSRFFNDYQTHPSLRLTSAGFSMTIWVCLIVMEKPAEVSPGDGCLT
jgi:hypothetical protein